MPNISVIIPVYGVEKFIEKCARSLFEQTMDNIEFVFVDDCTPDSSMDILKQTLNDYPNRKSQVVFCKTEKNSGLALARIKGLEYASGEYIIHCDSDDWVELDMYEKMYLKAKKDNLDIVMCGINEIIEGKSNYRLWDESLNAISSILLYGYGHLVNKLVKRDVAYSPECQPPQSDMLEDFVRSTQYCAIAKNIGYVNEPFYNYYRHPLSILGNRSSEMLLKKFDGMVKNFQIVYDFLRKKDLHNVYRQELIHEKLYIKNYILPVLREGEGYDLWEKTFPEVNKEILFCPLISIREKLLFIVTYFHLYPLFKRFLA